MLASSRAFIPSLLSASTLRCFATVNGTVKWFNVTKGFGFITPDNGAADVFVHQTAIESNGFRFLKEGERVKFDIVDSERGKQAVKVVSPTGEPLNRARSD